MSMFALYKNEQNPKRAQIDDALSGNLCRCTGYRPIIDACLHMYDYEVPSDDEDALAARLRDLRRERGLALERKSDHYHAPVDTAELAELYRRNPEARILAGGTDVGLWVTKQLRELPSIIYIGNVDALKQIRVDGDSIRIGAAVSLTDAFDALVPHYPEFGEMFRRFASVPVRNAGTLAGNVANGSPIGDSMPALIAVGARVVLRLGDRQRVLPMEDLYLDYMKNAMQAGEFVEAVEIPARDTDLLVRCYKLSKRFDQDISAVCAAFALRLEDDRIAEIRIALGGMAAIPKRAIETEGALAGRVWDQASVDLGRRKLADDFTPLGDMRASADYRARATANLLQRFYLETRRDRPLAETSVNVFAVHG